MRFLSAILCLLAFPLLADETPDAPMGTLSTQGGGSALGFTLGAGVAARPGYSGDEDVDLGPALDFELNYLRLGGLSFGDPDPLFVPEGFGLSGSLRYLPERDASDYSELRGLDDVDASLELGAGLSYATRDWRVFGNLRYGVIGHESLVGELGADAFLRPDDRWTFSAGPRLLFSSDDYASTYYGVSADEATASGGGLEAFDASGGLVSAGVELGASYRFNEDWGLEAALNYDRLQNDAADSPITTDDDQLSAQIGITRRFTLGF
jgi:outer membrane protein